VAVNFIISAPAAAAKVIEPEANGLRPKPICSRSGSRNGVAPTPMRKMSPPTTPGEKSRDREQPQIEDRVLVPPGVPDVSRERNEPDPDHRRDQPDRRNAAPDHA
jgi:hypothetical protein